MHKGFSRRAFLRRSVASTAAFTLTGTSLLQLGTAAHAQSADGYRALVCILLAGGADSFNMLVPTDDDGYAEYAGIRSDLALGRESLAPLGGTHQGGRTFGLHEALAPLTPLFDDGELAWVVNAGSLVEPTTPEGVAAGTARLPVAAGRWYSTGPVKSPEDGPVKAAFNIVFGLPEMAGLEQLPIVP